MGSRGTGHPPADHSAFLIGRTVYLRPPDLEKDVRSGAWFTWFNDKATTQYLPSQGIWPNTLEKQVAYVESLKEDRARLSLCIIDRQTEKHIGVISLYNIDLVVRRANISIVIGAKQHAPEAPLESMALMTEHAFDRLNLLKVDAGQDEALWKWINTLELIGYRLEGYTESYTVRDGATRNGVFTGVTAARFYALRRARGGEMLPADLRGLLRTRRTENMVLRAKAGLAALYEQAAPGLGGSPAEDALTAQGLRGRE